LMEWELEREAEILGENKPQRYSIRKKSPFLRPGIEPVLPRQEAGDL
jgi:hypothetical protein